MPDLAPSHERSPAARREEEVVEIPLLLPTRQAADLERAASAHGLTTGELARRLIRAFLGEVPRGD